MKAISGRVRMNPFVYTFCVECSVKSISKEECFHIQSTGGKSELPITKNSKKFVRLTMEIMSSAFSLSISDCSMP